MAASEQLLGSPGRRPGRGDAPALGARSGHRRARPRSRSTDAGCQAAGRGWRFDKGNGWWDGDYRSTLYNHYLTPNSTQFDCLGPFVPHNPAWKAARSHHPGGVNALFCDGHVQFVKDSINLVTHHALATRSGGEAISADAY